LVDFHSQIRDLCCFGYYHGRQSKRPELVAKTGHERRKPQMDANPAAGVGHGCFGFARVSDPMPPRKRIK